MDMKKIELAAQHIELGNFLEEIEEQFEQGTDIIRQARNQIKRIKVGSYDLCIKSFGPPTVFNRWMYSYFRKTKAKRSYNYARRLLAMGIATPKPIACVELYNRWHFLCKAYYICQYEDVTHTFAEVLVSDMPNKHLLVSDFVNYVVGSLHRQGVYHNDFNGTNVLVKEQGDRHHEFMLVDLNRITFKSKIKHHEGLRHLQQISGSPVYLAELAKYYARLNNRDEQDTIYELLFVKSLRRLQRRHTKRLLHALKTLF